MTTSKQTGELEACPFCGQEPVVTGNVEFSWRVECDWLACGVRPKTLDTYRTRRFAVEAWNSRAAVATPPVDASSIRDGVYMTILGELCDPDFSTQADTNTVAMGIADKVAASLLSKWPGPNTDNCYPEPDGDFNRSWHTWKDGRCATCGAVEAAATPSLPSAPPVLHRDATEIIRQYLRDHALSPRAPLLVDGEPVCVCSICQWANEFTRDSTPEGKATELAELDRVLVQARIEDPIGVRLTELALERMDRDEAVARLPSAVAPTVDGKQGCQGAGMTPAANGLQVINCKTCGRDWASLKAYEKHECVMRIELIYWLLRAYQSGHREGWEAGPSTDETMDRICDVLSNAGYDPSCDDANRLLADEAFNLRETR